MIYNPIGLRDPRYERPWTSADDAYKRIMAQTNDQRWQVFYANIRRYVPSPGAWKPEYEQYVRILYAPTLSSEWPGLAMVRSIYQQILYLDPVDYDWPKIKMPTLVIGGDKDTPDFPERAKHIAEIIPNGELVQIPNLGHVPHLEAPEVFYEAVLKFLNSGASPKTGRSQRTTALGRRLRAWTIAGRRAQVSRTDGIAFAGWERAGHAAVRRAGPLGLEARLGATRPSHDDGVGAGISLGH